MTTAREAFEAHFDSEFPNLKFTEESPLNQLLLRFWQAGRDSMREEAIACCTRRANRIEEHMQRVKDPEVLMFCGGVVSGSKRNRQAIRAIK